MARNLEYRRRLRFLPGSETAENNTHHQKKPACLAKAPPGQSAVSYGIPKSPPSTAQMNNRRCQKARTESGWRRWNSFAPRKVFCVNPDNSRSEELWWKSRKYLRQPAFASPKQNAPARFCHLPGRSILGAETKSPVRVPLSHRVCCAARFPLEPEFHHRGAIMFDTGPPLIWAKSLQMPELFVIPDIGDKILAGQAQNLCWRLGLQIVKNRRFRRTCRAGSRQKQASIHCCFKMLFGVNEIKRCRRDPSVILPCEAKQFSGDGRLAKYCDGRRPSTQGFYQLNQHPFRNIEIGFAGASLQAAKSLKIALDRHIAPVETGNRGICDPRKIAENEKFALKTGQFPFPVVFEKILPRNRRAPSRACLAESGARFFHIIAIDVPAEQLRAGKRVGGRHKKRANSASWFENEVRNNLASRQQRANLVGQRLRGLKIPKLNFRIRSHSSRKTPSTFPACSITLEY